MYILTTNAEKISHSQPSAHSQRKRPEPSDVLYPEQEGELGVSVADMSLFSISHVHEGCNHLAQAAQRSVYVTCFLRHRKRTEVQAHWFPFSIVN